VDSEYVLKGAVHSFHGALSFLHDSVLLFRNARYAGACVLGTIAGEHLGQSQWLLKVWQESAECSTGLDCRKFQTELKRDHERMLKDGLVSLQYKASEHLDQLGIRLAELKPGDPDYRGVADEYKKGHENIRRRAPAKFHGLRIKSQYVKPADDCRGWVLPSTIGPTEVHDLLINVGNCYRVLLYCRFLKEPPLLKAISDLGIREALEDASCTWPPPEADAIQRKRARPRQPLPKEVPPQ
jgi:hypothetical protein